jgi:phosphoserine phosphatase
MLPWNTGADRQMQTGLYGPVPACNTGLPAPGLHHIKTAPRNRRSIAIMTHVLTLICAPDAPALEDGSIALVRKAMQTLGGHVGSPRWLAPAVACDLEFDDLNADQAQAAARQALTGLPIDAAAQPLAGRRKAILLADMESTIIEQEMLDELGDLIGKRAEISAITARAMNGEIDFQGALRERVALLAGLPDSVLTDMIGRVTLMPGAATLLATLKAHDVYCALVSGGFRTFTRHVRGLLSFDEERANDLELADGRLTGRAVEPILDRQAKLQALTEIAATRGQPLSATLSVGDGANDLPMLMAAGSGVAYRAKPSVAAQARLRIDHGDLTALLYLQGYSTADIVAA